MLGPNGNTSSYKGAMTRLTDAEWMALYARRHGTYLLFGAGEQQQGKLFPLMSKFSDAVAGGQTNVRVVSHTDFVQARMTGGAR